MTDPLLNAYLQKWNLSHPLQIANTATSQVFTVSQDQEKRVLKLLTELGKKDEAFGPVALNLLGARACVRVISFDSNAQLLEYLEGPSLGEKVKKLSIDEEIDFTAKAIVQVFDRLHKVQIQKNPDLPQLADRFKKLERATEIPFGDSSLLAAAKRYHRELLADSNDQILHGDLHHGNILNSARGWLAIDPKGLLGPVEYDLANIFYNPHDQFDRLVRPERIQQLADGFSAQLNLDPYTIKKWVFIYGCLSSLWCLEDGIDPYETGQITKLVFDQI